MELKVIDFLKNGRILMNDAAAYLGLSPKTLRNRIFEGKGPRHEKRFGRLYFLVVDLDAYLESESRVREAYAGERKPFKRRGRA
jgi:hypothetical protein